MNDNFTRTLKQIRLPVIALFVLLELLYWLLAYGTTLNDGQGFLWDSTIMLTVEQFHMKWLISIFLFITRTGDILLAIPIVAAFTYLWRRRDKIAAILLLVSASISPLIALQGKLLLQRSRPEVFPPLSVETTMSFPSGHTLTAVGVYGYIAVLLWKRDHKLLAWLSGAWVFMIGFSRVYLGAHYPTDVLASLIEGAGNLIFLSIIEKRINQASPH